MKKDNDPINLTCWETQQILDRIKNTPPRNARFSRLMSDYREHNTDGSDSSVPWTPTDKATRWISQNREAIESSNAYIETHGLPLEKVRKF